ncbi:hypothetical protein BKA63DRAFT_575801 [Paraphoma chrysanthemicola]|nr:hypothetical protein BKA63DRAFT_575801 [Paraphoma chrysanthemicola]
MAPRTTATSANAHTTLKHPLQRRRDKYGFKISKNWLPQAGRLHRNPRPVHATAARHTYQSVVNHSLMHVPIFLRWIQSHTSPYIDGHDSDDCIMCQYKRLAATYWGAKSTGSRIEATNASVARIHEIASAASRSKGDAAEFYQWVTAQMKHANAPAQGTSAYDAWAVKNWREAWWNEEYRAIFQLDYDEEDTCRECGMVVKSSASAMTMNVVFDPATMHDLDGILTQSFFAHVRQAPCEVCAALTMHHRRRHITAAPQVLRICVDINTPSGHVADRFLNQTTKQLHPWDVPDQLNLGPRQANASLPLEYTLSSAIAHGGSGGRMEVGGQVVLPAARGYEEERQEEIQEEPGDSNDEEQDDSDDEVDSMEDGTTPSPRRNKGHQYVGTNKLLPWDEWESSENESVEEGSNDEITEWQESEEEDAEDDGNEDGQDEHNDSVGSSTSGSDFDPLTLSYPQPTGRTPQSPMELQQEYKQALLGVSNPETISGDEATDEETDNPSDIDMVDESDDSHSEPGDEEETGTDEGVDSRELGSRILNNLLDAGFREPSSEQSQEQEEMHSDSQTMNEGQSEEERELASRRRRLRTPSRPRKDRRNLYRGLHSLRKVENEDYLEELGPSLDDSLDAPSLREYGGEKIEENDIALFRRSSLVTPSRTRQYSRLSKPVSKRGSSSPFSRYLNKALSFVGMSSQRSNSAQVDSSGHQDLCRRASLAGDQPANAGYCPTSVDLTAFDPTVPNNGWRKEPNFSKHDFTWTANVDRPLPHQHHIINVRGPDNTSHVGNDHQEQLGPGKLHENPQRPGHDCYRPTGYQVIVLTYTRNPLKGAWGKLEWMIPEF